MKVDYVVLIAWIIGLSIGFALSYFFEGLILWSIMAFIVISLFLLLKLNPELREQTLFYRLLIKDTNEVDDE